MKLQMVTAQSALPGNQQQITPQQMHFVHKVSMLPPAPKGHQSVLLGMGCFWGAERFLWQIEGIYCTSVGYSGGFTVNPTYEQVCSGQTGHSEVVNVTYDPAITSFEVLLVHFWQNHIPTQGMRQGNDLGTQYRSAIYCNTQQQVDIAVESRHQYQAALTHSEEQHDEITTEISLAGPYYFAEEYHQQYLAKNPQGYCGLGGSGVCFPAE
ncbi:peptide-methionine (S)-S-oxide reductase MsrA [Aliivibrio kagoshimensis]|uniref:peptide-methionine (S)-S-oxide reductase MsrA n=1 Tax=Aliivibrio kagoshimensis TaxID=2910230 RepID=UPI003D115531